MSYGKICQSGGWTTSFFALVWTPTLKSTSPLLKLWSSYFLRNASHASVPVSVVMRNDE